MTSRHEFRPWDPSFRAAPFPDACGDCGLSKGFSIHGEATDTKATLARITELSLSLDVTSSRLVKAIAMLHLFYTPEQVTEFLGD